MAPPGFGGALDTPRTNIGDATYLPEFADVSQEASFQSPGKDGNLLQQLRNGRSNGLNLRTPRQRGPLADRRNLPPSVGGAEFTPLLKSATRNSVRRYGKENGAAVQNTPVLNKIDEDDMTPIPRVDSSSVASTPAAMQPRRGRDKGPLQDGNQLSLREQENVIDRIEKENFGLKLKIHFLEEALRKAGPGFSEAALRENTELKVDKVTMQRDLHRYKKHVTSAERDLENYRRQMMELQEKAKQREADMADLQHRLDRSQHDRGELEKFKDDIEDLEADLREKDRIITEREDELEDLRDKLEDAEDRARDSQRLAAEMKKADSQEQELEEAKETIQDLEQNIRRLEEQVEDIKDRMDEAMAQKERAEQDLQELQEDMNELDKSGQEYAALEKELGRANEENAELKATMKTLRQESKDFRQGRESDLIRESSSLQQEVKGLETRIQELEESLSQEREYALETEKDLRNQYSGEIERLNDEVSDLQAEIREKDNLYDNDSEKWENQRQTLESERDRAEEKAVGLQRTIDRLREAEGNLSDKEFKLKEAIESETERHKNEEAIMTRQIDDLQDALDTRQGLLVNLRNELSSVREELRQTQIDYQSQVTKVVALEDEVEVLQTSSAARGSQELETVKRECDKLRGQLSELKRQQKEFKRGDSPVSDRGAQQSAELTARLRSQLSDVTSQLERATKNQQSLQDQLATLKVQLHSSTTSLAEARAERDELDDQLRRVNSHDNDTLQVDQERLELRTAKMKLDNEVRRLKDENRALADQRAAIEKTLEDEFERAAAEDERLRQEVVELQAKLRQTSSSESQDLATARRAVRELERRIEDYQMQLANVQMRDGGDISSDLSMIRKDLSASRQKELEFLQRDSAHRDVVKGLKKQIADLERQLHDEEVFRLTGSPGASPARTDERGAPPASELRAQLSTAQRSAHEWESRSRDSERRAARATQDLQRQLSDLEDQKLVLEEVLEEARLQAEETAAQHDKAMRRMQHKLDQAERGRESAVEAQTANSKQHRHLRKSQAEVENLEHDVRQQQDLIDGLVAAEASLRRKLDRARSERAAYRMSAEKLQRDIQRLQRPAASSLAPAAGASQGLVVGHLMPGGTDEALETLVRAAQGAEQRHEKELRGMVMQVEWMQARWEREASLRSDAAYAKRFLQLQLDVANACNKAQLRELEHIRTNLLHSRKPLAYPPASADDDDGHPARAAGGSRATKAAPSLRPVLIAARFIARARISARGWAGHEAVRRRLAAAVEEQRRAKRSRRLQVVPADADA
ncbi:centrosomal targeting protein [Hirsutella rhossiliensis]|uniref:Centrosomal targeting protein n=1 Tax=Hirsutella rhossiliensis TaxID=111463 RepID=A0A9P8MMD6_9HYPO|nr:centrosomal targeting protein [Hirsutella rhossiliensis]KAH0957998.1 centrosomal targeting protein [Hirsutella rhossiliensis]